MTETKKGYHCAYDIHYHIVFPVKYRRALLDPTITKAIKQITLEIQERYQLEIEQVGADTDHIHLLCSAHPKHAPGSLVRLFKSITARQLFIQFPQLKKELWGGEFWSDDYYISTVSNRGNWKIVEQYVKNQGSFDQQTQLIIF